MGRPAIIFENVSKKYTIGSLRSPYRTIRETIMKAVQAPFRKLLKKEEKKQTLWALQDVSFELKHGESLAIIGNNGGGKSTLLKILSRITVPTKGRGYVYGRIGSLLEVGTGFHPELTGRENIFLNGSILGMKRKEILNKFDEIVAFAEIEKFLDTPVKHYSSGMYIRLAFGVAAHLETEILVVDEVLAVGDVRFQKKCLGKMSDVTKSGRTVLFVSHNMAAVRSLCQKGLWLQAGKVQKEGNINDVVNAYLSSNHTAQTAIHWDSNTRPGNNSMKMISVEIFDEYGTATSRFNISEEIKIIITYEIIEDNAHAAFSLSLISEDGVCAFSSLSNREKNFHAKPLKKGIYTSECTLYSHLLNNGHFYLTLIGCGANWSDSFTLDRILFLEAIDDGVLKADYLGPYGGSTRPLLNWNTQKVSKT